jgi:hypothetical protein
MIDYKDPKFQAWLRRVHQHLGNLTWKTGLHTESRMTKLMIKEMKSLWNMYQNREPSMYAAQEFLRNEDPFMSGHLNIWHGQHGIIPEQTKARAARVPRRQSYANIGREYLDIVAPKKQKFGKVIKYSDRFKK